MKKIISILVLALSVLLTSCGTETETCDCDCDLNNIRECYCYSNKCFEEELIDVYVNDILSVYEFENYIYTYTSAYGNIDIPVNYNTLAPMYDAYFITIYNYNKKYEFLCYRKVKDSDKYQNIEWVVIDNES